MKKILFLGAVAILLSLGLVLVSCSSCPGDGNCEAKEGDILITKWCGTSSTDLGDLETAGNCAAYKAYVEDKAGTCDC